MKPTPDTVYHWTAAQIASGNAQTCLHFGLHDDAAAFVDEAREHSYKVRWGLHQDTDETGFDV